MRLLQVFSRASLVLKTLWFFRRTHLALMAGMAIAAALLTGALSVGDSLRGSLRQMASARLGSIDHVLLSPGYFQDSLALRLRQAHGAMEKFTEVEALITIVGSCLAPESETVATQVSLFGTNAIEPGSCVLSQTLAQELALTTGEALVVRMDARGMIPAEASLGAERDELTSLRVKITRVAPPQSMQDGFSLFPTQRPVRNLWLNLQDLQSALKLPGRANLLWVSAHEDHRDERATAELQQLLSEVAQLEDYALRLLQPDNGTLVLESMRLFVPEPAAAALPRPRVDVLSYLANTIACKRTRKDVPYSMVVGIGSLEGRVLADDELALNEWTALELEAKLGDELSLAYYERTPAGLLVERRADFKVARILPMQGLGADKTLVPEFKGITDAESMASWQAPRDFNFDHSRVRQVDEDYWKKYSVAPKAFVSLNVAQRLWGLRFGKLTSARFTQLSEPQLRAHCQRSLTPESLGLSWQPIRAQQLAAASGSTDFAVLFISFSFFLIISAMLLVVLLMRLTVEQRARQLGVLSALGFSSRRIRRLVLVEGLCVLLLGCAAGAVGGVGVAELMLYALRTIWNDAVGTTHLVLHVRPTTLLAGFGLSVLLAGLALWRGVGRLEQLGLSALLGGSALFGPLPCKARRHTRWLAAATLLGAAVCVALGSLGRLHAALSFFGAGVLLLVGLLALLRLWLASAALSGSERLSLWAFALRNAGRNLTRSLLVSGLLAAAALITLATGTMKEGACDVESKHGGAGGYRLIAQLDVPVLYDPQTAEGRKFLKLHAEDESLWQRIECVALRSSSGQDASCRNLYSPAAPRMLGLPKRFIADNAFSFAALRQPSANPWQLLETRNDCIPAAVDAETAQWILHKGLGDILEVRDEFGTLRRLELVALLKKSIFQGELLISDENFLQLFPSHSGFNQFLIRAQVPDAATCRKVLSTGLAGYGLSVETSVERLASFSKIANTYISAFQALGGLGLLLGSLGLLIVLLRNGLERRSELALLAAVGFKRGRLVQLLIAENFSLLLAGLGVGALAGLVATLPVLSQGREPVSALVLTLCGFCAVVLILLMLLSMAARALVSNISPAALRRE